MTDLYTGALPNVRGRRFPIIYLTPEILLAPEIQSGSGGLGVVAGSYMVELEANHHIHETDALAIAFYCSYGYQTQRVQPMNGTGYMYPTYERDPFPTFTEDTGLRIQLILAGRPCMVAVRMPRDMPREHTAVLLLDTDIEENRDHPDFRMITRVLYGESHATAYFEGKPWHDIVWLRVLQAAVLGLGSYYVLKELGVTWHTVHLNESHPVFFFVHQFGLDVAGGRSREDALALVRGQGWFTNHTILDSGNKWYPYGTVMQVAGHYAGFSHDLLQWLDPAHGDNLSMTEMAFRLVGPGRSNGVSRHHAEIANRKWPGNAIAAVTNGVFVPQYQHPEFARLDRSDQIPELKRYIKSQLFDDLVERARLAGWNISADKERVLSAVLVAWARRGQKYKRAGMLWHREELDFARKLLGWGWIAIAWGGYVHPDDRDATDDWNRYFQRMCNLPNVLPVFNYRLDLMRPLLKAASEVWLNTPLFGHEACGTSWMGAELNCSLVITVPDGGVREASHVQYFGSAEMGNWHHQYQTDAREMWQAITGATVRLLERDPFTLGRLFDAKQEAEERFSATRMVADYLRLMNVHT